MLYQVFYFPIWNVPNSATTSTNMASNAPASPVSFEIRHTGGSSIYLNHDEFMLYKTNCHTVVNVSVYGDAYAEHKYTFNPRIIRKFLCVRELYISDVRFLQPIFTVPQTVRTITFRNCAKLTAITTNQKLTEISIRNCDDLTDIGPTIANICNININNCQQLHRLPHNYVNAFDEARDKLIVHLTDIPQIDLSTLPPVVASLVFDGSVLTRVQSTFPRMTRVLQLAPALMNIICESTGTIPESPYYDVYTMQPSVDVLSTIAMAVLMNQVMTRNVVVGPCISDANVQFIIQHLKSFVLPRANSNQISYAHVLDMLAAICPKYMTPVKSIKFDPAFSMYESIILASVPRFYSCLAVCKTAEPIKFSVFCNKMRDAMRLR